MFGIKYGNRWLKPVEFDWARNVYTNIPYPDINNSMTEFFQAIPDTKDFLNWGNPLVLKKGGNINGKRKLIKRNKRT